MCVALSTGKERKRMMCTHQHRAVDGSCLLLIVYQPDGDLSSCASVFVTPAHHGPTVNGNYHIVISHLVF